MKITRTTALADCQASWYPIDRADLAESLSKHARGNVRIGHGQLTTEGDKIVKVGPKDGFFRRDVAVLSFKLGGEHIANVFIEPDGTHGGPNGTKEGVEFDADDLKTIDILVMAWVDTNRAHIERAKRWFDEAPWTKVEVGMTVAQAIDVIRAAGW